MSARTTSGRTLSVRAGSGLMSAFATTALEVSATSGRAGAAALVTGGAGCAGPAEASFIAPALTWTVLTLTGFIGSTEPGMIDIGWLWITPLVNGAGSGLACSTLAGSARTSSDLGCGGNAAAAAAI